MKAGFQIVVSIMVSVLLVSCTTSRWSSPANDDLPVDTGSTRHEFPFGGHDRYYILHLPPAMSRDKPVPLVMVFHGGGGSPETISQVTGFNDLGDEVGFAVVYPSGTGAGGHRLFWNVLLSGTYATRQNVDDLTFVKEILDDLTTRLNVDQRRVYATGFSQGGMLCYRLACDPVLSTRIAAIAPVGATMTVNQDACNATRPVPIISFHGTRDPYSNYAGGVSERAPRHDRVSRPSVESSINYWLKRNNLVRENAITNTIGLAEMIQYGPDDQGVEVISWTVREGGHTWPGGSENLPRWLMGSTTRDVNASKMIWEFFSRHALPQTQ